MRASVSIDSPTTEHLRAVLASVAVGIISRDRARRILYVNQRAEALTGLPDKVMRGELCREVLAHADGEGVPLCERRCPAERCLADEDVVEQRLWLRTASGERLGVVSSFVPLRDPEGAVVGTVETITPDGGRLSLGDATADETLLIDLARRQVFRDGAVVRLTRTEFALLACLAREPERAVSHAELLQQVWGPECEGQTQYLHTFISQLRRKLEPDPRRPRHITTEPQYGYRLRLTSAPGEPSAEPSEGKP